MRFMSAWSSWSLVPKFTKLVSGRVKLPSSVWVRDQHADGELAVHDLEAAEDQHGRGRRGLDKGGTAPAVGHLAEVLLGVDRLGVVAGPAAEELALGAGRLEGLDHA